jgi:tetratricopeptide (TPR) repeat protein
MPKIIDFGVAKALSQNLIGDTLFTRVGAMIGTLEYMSPEQALSSGIDVDTRTDVYSLGIVLYELLAGALPRDLRKIAFDEFLRRLRHEDPHKPSTAISTHDPATSMELARRRRTVPRALVKEIRGDMDNIVMKAMNREPARRYRSVEQMSEDILRHIESRPVIARPDTIAYRLSRFAVRNRWGLAAALAVFLSLTAGTLVSVRQAIVARQRFDQVRKLAGRFIALNREVARLPGSTAVREKLVATGLEYLSDLAHSAGDDPTLLDELGQAYGQISFAQGSPGDPSLGETESALASLRKAIEFESRAAAIDPIYWVKVANQQSSLAYQEMVGGHLPEARKDLKAAAALLTRLRAEKPDDLNLLKLSAGVALYQGDLAAYEGHARDGLRDFQQARQIMENYCRISPNKQARYQLHMVSVSEAQSLAENGRYDEALGRLRVSEPIIEGLLAEQPDNPNYIREKMAAANGESTIYDSESEQNLHKPVEAVAAGRRYLGLAEQLVNADPHNASARLSLAIANFQLSYPLGKIDPPESLRLAQSSLRILDEDLARSPGSYLLRSRRARALRYLAYALNRSGRPAEARETLQKALGIQRQLLIETPSNADERAQIEFSQKALLELK